MALCHVPTGAKSHDAFFCLSFWLYSVLFYSLLVLSATWKLCWISFPCTLKSAACGDWIMTYDLWH